VFVSPNILLEPASPRNKSRKILGTSSSYQEALHAHGARQDRDFRLSNFFIRRSRKCARIQRCCEQDVLQCSVTPRRIVPVLESEKQEKHRNQFTEHVIGLGMAKAPPDPRGKNEPLKN
jgi:hypothetical protein